MRRLALVAALAFAVPAFAQVQVRVTLPSIVFPAPPRLVLVEPGVQVVDNYDEEVYFVDGFYWHHNGPNWYRTNAYTGGWVQVEPRIVPPRIAVYEPGRFRRWHGSDEQRRELRVWHEGRERREERIEDRHERREDRRDVREERRDDRREGVHDATPGGPPPGGAVNPGVPGQPGHSATPVQGPPGKGKGKGKVGPRR
jgi:hypothetical protein